MKRSSFLAPWVMILAFFMTACSGGGGGSGASAPTGGAIYSGVTTQASLTSANANQIFAVMWNGGASSETISPSSGVAKAGPAGSPSAGGFLPQVRWLANVMAENAAGLAGRAKSAARVIPVNETRAGTVSGTATMTGSVDDSTGLGSVTMTYANYNDGDGFTHGGALTMRVDAYDMTANVVTDGTLSFAASTVKSATSDFAMSGSIRLQVNAQSGSEVLTINMDGRDNLANETFRFENYVLTTTAGTESYSGRVYADKFGYVEVSTIAPCMYTPASRTYPSSGGPMILAGAGNSKASVTVLSASQVKIEVDDNGDGINEGKNAYAWDSLKGAPATAVPPSANAGPDQSVATGAAVTLSGTGSSVASGAVLSYSWSFTAKPAGSAAVLANPTAPNPTFVADKSGAYVLSLIVSDGLMDSAADTVTVAATAATSSAPLANAGPDQIVTTGNVVLLYGGSSSDVGGAPLAYSWSFTAKPAGSTAALSNPAAANPTFLADMSGSYALSLIVNNGSLSSAADTVLITAATAGSAPVANAGPDQNVATGAVVQLNGSGSSGATGYAWSFTAKPAGSNAALSSSTAVSPTFTADVRGSYVLSLLVTNGALANSADSVTITATPALLAVDQEQPFIDITVGGLGIGGASQEKLAQVVTAGASGMLTEVRFPVACESGDLIVQIQGVTGGIPNGAVLATQAIPAASLPAFFPTPGVVSLRNLVFTTPAPISAGSQFAVILSSTGECGVFQGPLGDSYSGGSAFFDARPNAAGVWVCISDFAGARFDLPFQTLIEPVN